MKRLSATEKEVPEILVWESTFLSLTDDQKSLCVALHRSKGHLHEEELAACLGCTIDEVKNASLGIYGILVDSSTRNYWIK